MTWQLLSNFMQIIVCLTLMVTTGIWMYIFRWFFKHHIALRSRVDSLEREVHALTSPRYRGCV